MCHLSDFGTGSLFRFRTFYCAVITSILYCLSTNTALQMNRYVISRNFCMPRCRNLFRIMISTGTSMCHLSGLGTGSLFRFRTLHYIVITSVLYCFSTNTALQMNRYVISRNFCMPRCRKHRLGNHFSAGFTSHCNRSRFRTGSFLPYRLILMRMGSRRHARIRRIRRVGRIYRSRRRSRRYGCRRLCSRGRSRCCCRLYCRGRFCRRCRLCRRSCCCSRFCRRSRFRLRGRSCGRGRLCYCSRPCGRGQFRSGRCFCRLCRNRRFCRLFRCSHFRGCGRFCRCRRFRSRGWLRSRCRFCRRSRLCRRGRTYRRRRI